MNEKDIQLKNAVAKRVETVFYMRTVVRPLIVESGLLVGSVTAMCLLISVPNIISNLVTFYNVSFYAPYLASAFLHTALSVQILSILSVVFFAVLTKDIIKNLRHLRKFNFA